VKLKTPQDSIDDDEIPPEIDTTGVRRIVSMLG
jgi:hypothetical protein